MITVYTCILNGIDNLRTPSVVEPDVRYVCFADQPLRCDPWEVLPLPYMAYIAGAPGTPAGWDAAECARRNSRLPKILAHLHVDSEYSIWHDGCLTIAAKASDLVKSLLRRHDIAMYHHSCRSSIYEEHEACQRMAIGNGHQMDRQIERYRAEGVGDGLWAGGAIIRRHTEAVAHLNELWWIEYINGCARDQISFPAARHAAGIEVEIIPGSDVLTDNDRFNFHFHSYIEKSNRGFEEARARRAAVRSRLEELCKIEALCAV